MTSSERRPLLATGDSVRSDGTSNDSDEISNKEQGIGPRELSKSSRAAILICIWSSTWLSTLNMTLVATLVSSISSQFNRANQASWLGTSYLLAICTFTPLYGRLCDVLGRRGALQTALLLMGTGTVMCGLSNNLETLIVARFLAGMGGGGIITTSSIITSDMYNMRDRSLTQGINALFTGLGMGLGGWVGGFISDRWGWRWAFLIQGPAFVVAFCLASWNVRYVTPGKGQNRMEILKRIDYGGCISLLIACGSYLIVLSLLFNDRYPLSSPKVLISFFTALIAFASFIVIELFVAPAPVLAPSLLRQKIPVLVGINNFLVATCNFTVQYFFPMWFQTVMLTSPSIAGLHLTPNSVSMSCGSLFAGWMMHRTGKYKALNIVFGILPTIAAFNIARLREDSSSFQQWFTIIPLGFGNAVVFQTTLIALLAFLPKSAIAVGTGFTQLFRGIGQVSGVAISSAIFQARLDHELHVRLSYLDEDLISRIRHSSTLVASLPPEIQRAARDSYAASLKTVFIFATACTFAAFLVRLPIPEQSLDEPEQPKLAPEQPADAGVARIVSPSQMA